MTQSQAAGAASTLHLPRILCLHGGGVNAQVFEMQCRGLIAGLRSSFRLVFAEGPLLSKAHPAAVAVYGEFGPFRRWVRWLRDQPELPSEENADEVLYACRAAMADDPGTGPWVGALGFSQGANMVASLLWTQQALAAAGQPPPLGDGFKFGVIMAGHAPPVNLAPRQVPGDGSRPPHIGNTGHFALEFEDWPPSVEGAHVLRMPTLHVHGLADENLQLHRRLLNMYCAPGTATSIEWDGGHRLPFKKNDLELLCSRILAVARQGGVQPGENGVAAH